MPATYYREAVLIKISNIRLMTIQPSQLTKIYKFITTLIVALVSRAKVWNASRLLSVDE